MGPEPRRHRHSLGDNSKNTRFITGGEGGLIFRLIGHRTVTGVLRVARKVRKVSVSVMSQNNVSRRQRRLPLLTRVTFFRLMNHGLAHRRTLGPYPVIITVLEMNRVLRNRHARLHLTMTRRTTVMKINRRGLPHKRRRERPVKHVIRSTTGSFFTLTWDHFNLLTINGIFRHTRGTEGLPLPIMRKGNLEPWPTRFTDKYTMTVLLVGNFTLPLPLRHPVGTVTVIRVSTIRPLLRVIYPDLKINTRGDPMNQISMKVMVDNNFMSGGTLLRQFYRLSGANFAFPRNNLCLLFNARVCSRPVPYRRTVKPPFELQSDVGPFRLTDKNRGPTLIEGNQRIDNAINLHH